MTETIENVSEALSSETFDVLDFVAGAGGPRDTVTVFTDKAAGYELLKLLAAEEVSDADIESQGLSIADDVPWIDPVEREALVKRINDSKITFHLQGLTPERRKEIRNALVEKHDYKEDEDPALYADYFEEFSAQLIAESIQKVVNAKGQSDTKPWTTDRVLALKGMILDGEYARLDAETFQLTYNAEIFDRAVNADFLSRR